jgi:CRP/FNR family transcriptional regulator
LKDIEARLANWLLKHCLRAISDTPQTIQLEATKRVLAAEMGTTSETLSRTLAKFREQKLLQFSGHTITITQPRALEELLRRHLGEM